MHQGCVLNLPFSRVVLRHVVLESCNMCERFEFKRLFWHITRLTVHWRNHFVWFECKDGYAILDVLCQQNPGLDRILWRSHHTRGVSSMGLRSKGSIFWVWIWNHIFRNNRDISCFKPHCAWLRRCSHFDAIVTSAYFCAGHWANHKQDFTNVDLVLRIFCVISHGTNLFILVYLWNDGMNTSWRWHRRVKHSGNRHYSL